MSSPQSRVLVTIRTGAGEHNEVEEFNPGKTCVAIKTALKAFGDGVLRSEPDGPNLTDDDLVPAGQYTFKVVNVQGQGTTASGAVAPGGGAAEASLAVRLSPRSRFQDWARQNPLQSIPYDPEAMMQLITRMPLPDDIRNWLVKFMYKVPRDGFFTTVVPTVGGLSVAFTRRDLVDLFKEHIMQPQATPVRALITHGRRRTGKSFGTPHSLVTAYAECEAAGIPVLVRPASHSGGSTTTTMAVPPTTYSSGSSGQGSGRSSTMAARVPWILHMLCDEVSPPPSQDQLNVLFDAVIYLRIPMVLDEWTQWHQIGPALRYVLAKEADPDEAPSSVLRAQFVLIDSDHARVSAAVHPALSGRESMGVFAARMPNPSMQLVASIFHHLHPAQYNTGLLHTIATCGHKLDRLFMGSIPIISLNIISLADLTVLRGDPLQAMEQIVRRGYATAQDPFVTELSRAGYLGYDSFNTKKLLLLDPLLVTISSLGLVGADADANSMEQALAANMATAEGKVLELVARQLASEILEALGIAGAYKFFFGSISQAELDLLVEPSDGPLVLVSCKRSQAAQEQRSFTTTLDKLKEVEGREWSKTQDASKKQNKLDDYRTNDAVSIIQRMVKRKKLMLVGLSAVPGSTPSIPPFEHALNFEGQQHMVQCEYHSMLLHGVLKPATPEALERATTLARLLKV